MTDHIAEIAKMKNNLDGIRDTIVGLCSTIRQAQKYLRDGADSDLIIAELSTGLAAVDAERIVK